MVKFYFIIQRSPDHFYSGDVYYIFPAEGAYPYQRDLPDVEFHLLDTGHFALEEEGDAIARYITDFFTQDRSQPAFL